MAPETHYEVLGVGEDATLDDIRTSYRKLAMKHHPDKAGGSEEKFKEISGAYSILSDKGRRQAYDAGVKGNLSGIDAFDLFRHFFAQDTFGSESVKSAPPPLKLSAEVSLRGVCQKKTVRITYNRLNQCSKCSGTKLFPGKSSTKCSACSGEGARTEVRNMMFFQIPERVICTKCHGSGKIILPEDECDVCQASGTIEIEEKIEIKASDLVINPTILIPKKGNYSIEAKLSGDLQIDLSLRGEGEYRLRGHHLYRDTKITAFEALAGFTRAFQHPGGYSVKVYTSGVTAHRAEYRVKGKGASDSGDLILCMRVHYPTTVASNSITAIREVIIENGLANEVPEYDKENYTSLG